MVRKTGTTYLGFDLGASSGRAVVGFIDKNRLEMEEIHRFSNEHLELDETLRWMRSNQSIPTRK